MRKIFDLEFRNQQQRGVYPSGIFKEYPAQEMLERNRPDYFERNIENMIAICQIQKIPIILMTFASSPHFPDHPFSSSAEYRKAFREQNAVVKDLSRRYSVECYDFESEMPKDLKYWEDGRHMNESGAELKARLTARYLLESGLLPG